MSFTPSIPASGQSLGSSRTEVLNNFASLRSTISNASLPNHIDVNSTGAGKHIFVQMPVQTPAAANLTLSGEFGLIAQTSNGNSELFYNRDGSNTAGTPNYIQLTTGNPTAAATGTSYLPGGIIIKWGTYATGGDGSNISFVTAFPNACWNVVLTIHSSSTPSSNIYVIEGSLTTSRFQTGKTGASNFPIFYMAIGN